MGLARYGAQSEKIFTYTTTMRQSKMLADMVDEEQVNSQPVRMVLDVGFFGPPVLNT